MRNVWIMSNIRKTTRKTIREALGDCRELDDEQIDFAIETAAKHFYAHRTQPWELAMEGAIVFAALILAKMRCMFVTDEAIANLNKANEDFNDWLMRVKS